MSTNTSSKDSSKEESKEDITPQTIAETSLQSGESAENSAPLVEQQQSIMDLIRNALNPNGENPQVDEYLTSTFSYIQNVINKMQTAEDKDATAEEIAQDLTNRFDKWISEREDKTKDSVNHEEQGKKEDPKELLKMEDVD